MRDIAVETAAFWLRVKKLPDGEGGCWLWQGGCDGRGYGRLRFQGRNVRAYRLSYELAHGPIPEGLMVRHKCDQPPCVRPEHLELGTHKDNMADVRARKKPKLALPAGGHVRKRPKGWEVVVELGRDPVSGKRRQLSRMVKGSRRDAETVRAHLVVEASSGRLQAELQRRTVGELLDEWWRIALLTLLRTRSMRVYQHKYF